MPPRLPSPMPPRRSRPWTRAPGIPLGESRKRTMGAARGTRFSPKTRMKNATRRSHERPPTRELRAKNRIWATRAEGRMWATRTERRTRTTFRISRAPIAGPGAANYGHRRFPSTPRHGEGRGGIDLSAAAVFFCDPRRRARAPLACLRALRRGARARAPDLRSGPLHPLFISLRRRALTPLACLRAIRRGARARAPDLRSGPLYPLFISLRRRALAPLAWLRAIRRGARARAPDLRSGPLYPPNHFPRRRARYGWRRGASGPKPVTSGRKSE